MFKLLLILSILSLDNALPNKIDNKCCINHPKRKNVNLTIANYNCEQLTPFGQDRCGSVLGGNVCKWAECKPIGKCMKSSKYEIHYGKSIDVGRCIGICQKEIIDKIDTTDTINTIDTIDTIDKIDTIDTISNVEKKFLTCSPTEFDIVNIKKKSVKVITECACQNCGIKPKYELIKIPSARCVGICQERQNVCLAGIIDNYNSINGVEVSNPSIDIINSAAMICPLGIQNGFDHFIDNRCFVHTFRDCLKEGQCPIRTLLLDICMQAAQVSLTQTDSLRLGTNGNGLWGSSLPILNGGSWNPGDNICLSLDLNNLPGGVSIINNIIMDGNLDVLVQDDTAVDFLRLTTLFENCNDCLPVDNIVHSFYSTLGLQHFRDTRDCDCLDTSYCHREKLEETFYPGTNYEIRLDVGQCIGKCENGHFCNKKSVLRQIKTPYGSNNIEIIEDCFC